MAVVHIPSPLRRYTNNLSKVEAAGGTIGEIIESLESQYPGVKSRLCESDGQIKRYVNIFVNEDEVRTLQGIESAVGASDKVSIIPAMAGGK